LSHEPYNAQALFGLGTYSRRLRDSGDSKAAAELGDYLVNQLGAVPGPSALTTVLRAIANSGYDGALDKVMPYLNDAREEVRAVAVRALQSMRVPAADGLIAKQLVSDPAAEVRVAAVAAARVREPAPSVVQALLAAATKDADSRVRYRAVEQVTHWLPQVPTFRSALEDISKHDAEERIRGLARSALQ
jgi:HEAT repeat protein